MKSERLCRALAALVIIGGTWSQAATGQQVEIPDLRDNNLIPDTEDAAPPPEGIDATAGDLIFGDMELPDAANTDGPWPFTINIPVSLSNLHEDVADVFLSCTVQARHAGQERYAFGGYARVKFDEVSRSFDDTVNVRLSKRTNDTWFREIEIGHATWYWCKLMLNNVSDELDHVVPSCLQEGDPGVFFHTAEADPDDCYDNGALLKTATVTGEINPREGTATTCRYGGSDHPFVDCQ